MNRRKFLSLAVSGTVLGVMSGSPLKNIALAAKKADIKAIAFDAFPVFDPGTILGLAKSLFPDHERFGKQWFNKIFSYTWLRTSADQYKNFYGVIEDALVYTAEQNQIKLTSDTKNKLMDVWLQLKPWSDVLAALRIFRKNNIRLAFLSNFTEEMLRTNSRNNGIESAFEYFSTDEAGAFKPDPRAYQLGINGFGMPKRNIAFCAFAAWDAAGASWFGYPTVWVNRLEQPAENLGAQPAVSGTDIKVLVDFVVPTDRD